MGPLQAIERKRQRARARAVEKVDCSLDVEEAKGKVKEAEKDVVEWPSLRILLSEGG